MFLCCTKGMGKEMICDIHAQQRNQLYDGYEGSETGQLSGVVAGLVALWLTLGALPWRQGCLRAVGANAHVFAEGD